uniref:extracellular matrix protein 1 n=1 Tax=Euleptes europaea TaxID=460621 RepID=UPI0025401DC7|nr:extracellular matrix protein 1 [Euleptes europaea]
MQMKMLAVLLASWLALAQSVTLEPKDDRTELPPPAGPEDMLQKEIDLGDIRFPFGLQEEIDPFGTPVEQREVTFLPLLIHGEPQTELSSLTTRGRRPSGPGCIRGVNCGGRPRYPSNLAEFPPGRPSLGNIGNICAEGRQKASYGPWNLPQSSFSHLYRQADALNDLEADLSRCCQLPEDEKLNCSQAVWSDALENFCEAEFSVKTSHYYCCKRQGTRKENCFASEAPFPNYDYVSEEPQRGEEPSDCAHSDPAQCKPKDQAMAQKLPAISFPPGRPSDANIRNVCKLRKFRPVYPEGTLPQTGFGWFVRQARAINRLEKEFKKCCRKEDVRCAHRGWEKVLIQFCKQESSVKTRPHFCCKEAEGEDRFACFTNQAPFPAYDREIQVVNLAEVTPSLLDLLCSQFSLLSKQKHIPALVQNITEPCCELKGDERTQCAQEEKSQFIITLCNSPRASWKDAKKCCAKAEDAARIACFDSTYLSNVTLASAGQTPQPTEPAE